jgi:hypothetical protein
VGGSWPLDAGHGESSFSDYFREQFFSSNNLGSQTTRIYNIEVADGELVALLVSARSGINVPKPSAGMVPAPKLRGIFAKRRL